MRIRLLAGAGRRRWVPTLRQVFDLAGVEIVARSEDFHFPGRDQIGHDPALHGDLSRRAPGVFAHGVVDEIAGLVLHRPGRRDDRLDHRPDGAREGRLLADDVARRRHRAAAFMAEHDDQRHAEHGGAVFDRAHGRGVGRVAGIAGDEQLADTEAPEQQFRRHAAVGAAQDGRPRRLRRRHRRAAPSEIGRAHLRRLDVFGVAGFQIRQRLVGVRRRRRTVRGGGLINPEKSAARRKTETRQGEKSSSAHRPLAADLTHLALSLLPA